MSLWWAKREQLDRDQLRLIEELPLQSNSLVLGPPGSGKTNVLLRRAQFVRAEQFPNVLVLTFTRALTEFIKTGCFDAEGREIFPPKLVNTFEGWIRWLYEQHEADLPAADPTQNLALRKRFLAQRALEFPKASRIPKFDTLFVDEAQDLLAEEVQLLDAFSENLFFVGDDRQKIYETAAGLQSVRSLVPTPSEHLLKFHYRLVGEICRMADRLQVAQGGDGLAATSHYDGPKPGRIESHGPLERLAQVAKCSEQLKDQVRVYADLIKQGDRLGIIVPKKIDRDSVLAELEKIPELEGKAQIIRANTGQEADRHYNPSFDPECPISIMTVPASKGLEFRAVHWLFCDSLTKHYSLEHYYTVVTRAKTSLDLYFANALPQDLARSYAPRTGTIW
jgi:superfamily I DNA/RNA helicase